MKVRDILRVKGSTLFTVAPDTALQTAVLVMSEHDIGSLVVMDYDKLVGILTFREVISALAPWPIRWLAGPFSYETKAINLQYGNGN
jgi:CBS domain-containing protein